MRIAVFLIFVFLVSSHSLWSGPEAIERKVKIIEKSMAVYEKAVAVYVMKVQQARDDNRKAKLLYQKARSRPSGAERTNAEESLKRSDANLRQTEQNLALLESVVLNLKKCKAEKIESNMDKYINLYLPELELRVGSFGLMRHEVVIMQIMSADNALATITFGSATVPFRGGIVRGVGGLDPFPKESEESRSAGHARILVKQSLYPTDEVVVISLSGYNFKEVVDGNKFDIGPSTITKTSTYDTVLGSTKTVLVVEPL